MGVIINKQFDEEYNNFIHLLNSEQKDIRALANRLMKMYTIAKTYKGNNLSHEYVNMLKRINECELNLPKAYIIKTNSIFERKDTDTQISNIDLFESKTAVLDYIVSTTRNYLFNKYLKNTSATTIDDINYSGLCAEASKFVEDLCLRLRIKRKNVRIDCGFSRELDLFYGYGFHCFVIVSIDDEEYLIDCTYKQFFELKGNLLERMGTQDLNGCYPGIYMLQNNERKEVARQLISRGWIKLTEENMKNYFDGFALSYRNGIYYDMLGKVDFTTDYTYDDYIEFIFGNDNQANYEPLEGLGYQRARIKNSAISFKTDKNLLKKIY